ncbi:phage tail protein, P2 protein I family [Streptomyces sp. Ncost-T6T-2b]|nr:phage tail protein, P2 protein I family [Streptomyces sp. Ncost-T6T-2b]
MTRAAVPGLPSRYPIGELLPALYADDDLAQRFTAGLDTVLAPVLSTLDNLPAYVDPALAPADFLPWLASWVGVEADPAWPVELRRAVVAHAVELHRWRGTRRGLVERLRLVCGVHAEVRDGGGADLVGRAGGRGSRRHRPVNSWCGSGRCARATGRTRWTPTVSWRSPPPRARCT